MRRLLLAALLSSLSLGLAAGQDTRNLPVAVNPHDTPEWATVAPHLPDPAVADLQTLEMTGDVLRARRFPLDAMTFYRAALNKGGHRDILLKKIGVLYLETQQTAMARLTFVQTVKLNKSDAEAWNDLAATDFTLGNTRTSVGEYKKAIKNNKSSAVFHANLALAYFELKDSDSARHEMARALQLDPGLLQRSNHGGYNMQLLSSTHYAEMCFEMARMYATQGDAEEMLQWLTKASERGMNVRRAMQEDAKLSPYLKDPRIQVMLGNTDQLHAPTMARVKPPSLGEAGK